MYHAAWLHTDYATRRPTDTSQLHVLQAIHAAHVKAGQRVLIQGGNGGIGSVAVQMAKAWGCHVTATCSTKNLKFVKVSSIKGLSVGLLPD